MSLYWWNFEIKVIPAPPSGINQATRPPPPETVSTALTEVYYREGATQLWLLAVRMGADKSGNSNFLENQLEPAIRANNINLAMDPWPQAIRYAGIKPDFRTVRLYAIASWEQIYSANNTGGSSGFKIETQDGVTTSDTETRAFSATAGFEASAGWGPISATVSASFTAETGTAHSVSFTQLTTKESKFDIPTNTFGQIWQLKMHMRADENGPALTQAVPSFQSLTYPLRTETRSTAEIEATAKAEVEELLARIR